MEKGLSLAMANLQTKKVHGIEIKKMPLKSYMQFAAKGGALIPYILDKLFPDMSTPQVVTSIMALNRDGLARILTQVLVEAPQMVFEAFAELLGVEVNELIDNPQIGPSELWDIIDAWREVNDLTDFFGRVSKLFHRP